MSVKSARYTDRGADATFLRLALFEETGYRCWIHPRSPHTFTDLELDHIISRDEFRTNERATRSTYDLAPDFDFHGLENLAPAGHACNGEKGDLPLSRAAIDIALGKARARMGKVQERIDRYRRAPAAALLVAQFLGMEAELVRQHASEIMRHIVGVDISLAYAWESEEQVTLSVCEVLDGSRTGVDTHGHDVDDFPLTVSIDEETRAADLLLRAGDSSLSSAVADVLEMIRSRFDESAEEKLSHLLDPSDSSTGGSETVVIVDDLHVEADLDEATALRLSGRVQLRTDHQYHRAAVYFSDNEGSPHHVAFRCTAEVCFTAEAHGLSSDSLQWTLDCEPDVDIEASEL